MSHNKTWQPYEREVVIQKIQKYPHNFSEAFAEAGRELGRSSSAVSNQFNKVIRPELNKNRMVLTAQGSAHGMIVNSKNVPRKVDAKLAMVMEFVDHLNKEQQKFVATEIFKKM